VVSPFGCEPRCGAGGAGYASFRRFPLRYPSSRKEGYHENNRLLSEPSTGAVAIAVPLSGGPPPTGTALCIIDHEALNEIERMRPQDRQRSLRRTASRSNTTSAFLVESHKLLHPPTGARVFKKVLIANRGDASASSASASSFGIKTVRSIRPPTRLLHVRFADEAVCIGPPNSRESYLKSENLAAAEITGADRPPRGYGFRRNAALPRSATPPGSPFIGPPRKMISAMGTRRSRRRQ